MGNVVARVAISLSNVPIFAGVSGMFSCISRGYFHGFAGCTSSSVFLETSLRHSCWLLNWAVVIVFTRVFAMLESAIVLSSFISPKVLLPESPDFLCLFSLPVPSFLEVAWIVHWNPVVPENDPLLHAPTKMYPTRILVSFLHNGRKVVKRKQFWEDLQHGLKGCIVLMG